MQSQLSNELSNITETPNTININDISSSEFKNKNDIGGYKVTDVDLKDGVKLMLGEKNKILVRPSGTEPLLRIYFESDSVDTLEALKLTVAQN